MKAHVSKCNGVIPNNENDLIDKIEEKDEVEADESAVDITSHISEPCHSLICDRVGRKHFWIEGEFKRSNQLPQRNKRAKAGYGLVREMQSFTSKRNGALDKECENAESLTMLSRELVLKEFCVLRYPSTT